MQFKVQLSEQREVRMFHLAILQDHLAIIARWSRGQKRAPRALISFSKSTQSRGARGGCGVNRDYRDPFWNGTPTVSGNHVLNDHIGRGSEVRNMVRRKRTQLPAGKAAVHQLGRPRSTRTRRVAAQRPSVGSSMNWPALVTPHGCQHCGGSIERRSEGQGGDTCLNCGRPGSGRDAQDVMLRAGWHFEK